MEIKTIPAGVYAANCYLLIDEKTRECGVIDPGGDAPDIIREIEKLNLNVKYIFLTHGHTDHTSGVAEIKEKYSADVCLTLEDEKMILGGTYIFGPLTKSGRADIHIKDGDTFKIGDITVTCIETPGHTPGGVCLTANDVVFTGDTLFSGSIGRTDFAGGNFDTIINSIKTKLMTLQEDTIVLPGHGGKSSIKREKLHNPFL